MELSATPAILLTVFYRRLVPVTTHIGVLAPTREQFSLAVGNPSALVRLRASRRLIKKQPLSNAMTNKPRAAPSIAIRIGQFTHSDMIGRALIARRYRQQTHFVHLPHVWGLMHLALSQKPRYHDVRVGHHNRVGSSERCESASPGEWG
jgi:hypothetical protein